MRIGALKFPPPVSDSVPLKTWTSAPLLLFSTVLTVDVAPFWLTVPELETGFEPFTVAPPRASCPLLLIVNVLLTVSVPLTASVPPLLTELVPLSTSAPPGCTSTKPPFTESDPPLLIVSVAPD